MGFYKYLKDTFRSEYAARSPVYKKRITGWRKSPPLVRVERPTNVARARELGYKAKQGYVVVRARIEKGMRKRPAPDLGRKPSKSGRFYSPKKSHQWMAEERAAAHYRNMEVLNSYWVGEDGSNSYFEIILIDRTHPNIRNDFPNLGKGRAARGLTSIGRKGRGLLRKGIGAEKIRPSIRAHERRGK